MPKAIIDVGRVQPIPHGEYDPNIYYEAMDIVSFAGSSYWCKHKGGYIRGVPPTDTDEWMLVAQKGDTGKQGEEGKEGKEGPQGEDGGIGPTGAQGPIGKTPDIHIGDVTTGEMGAPAKVVITGTPETPILNLTLPQGDARQQIAEMEQATQDGREAANNANEAAGSATAVTNKLKNLSADITMLPPNEAPRAEVTQTDTSTTFDLRIPKSNLSYATFDINFATGELVATYEDGYAGPTFEINPATGELEMTING